MAGAMRWMLVLLVACSSTRQLTGTGALQIAGHREGWVVPTTGRWHERIDPLTSLQFQRADGTWSEAVHGFELNVDRDGAWIDQQQPLGYLAEQVSIDEVSSDVGEIIVETRPKSATLDIDQPDATHLTVRYRLAAPRADLDTWLAAIVLGVARLDPIDNIAMFKRMPLTGDVAKLYQLREVNEAAALGHWRLFARSRGWFADFRGKALAAATERGFGARVGWAWAEVQIVEVTNLSGSKTLGAIIGISALAVALAPMAVIMRSMPFGGGGGGGSGGGGSAIGNVPGPSGDGSDFHKATWDPAVSPQSGLSAAPLFSTGAQVRSWVQPILAFDSTLAYRADLLSTGMTARIRIAEVWEIGGGVRESLSHGTRSTTGVFTTGLHLPLDAGMRFAIPVGFEVASGGEIKIDLRVPIGLRYSTDHWFVTASPATPEYLHAAGSPRRWSLASTLELGYAF